MRTTASALPYGAADLKKLLPQNLSRGLALAAALHLAAFGAYKGVTLMAEQVVPEQEIQLVNYADLGPPPSVEQPDEPPPPEAAAPAPPATAAGVPVAVPDAEADTTQTLASQDELNQIVGTGTGDGIAVATPPPAALPPPPPPPPAPDPTPEVFVVVEQQPELVGGLPALQAKMQYPEIAKRAGVEGRVIVQFVVDEQGKVRDPFVVRGVGAGLDEEALRAVRQAVFKPGMQRGKPVRVQMTLPITFRLR